MRGGIQSKKLGDFGEAIARFALKEFGVNMIERVHTPWKVLWRNGRPVQAFTVEKVSGDFIGIGPAGKKVLAEVKYREESLSLSDFENHQLDALDKNHQYGGVSLVIWVTNKIWSIYWWSGMALKKGAPIKPGETQGLQMSREY